MSEPARRESGMALIVVILAMLLLSAIGAALLLTASAETIIAANYRSAQEGLYVAEAATERILPELLLVPDWNAVLDGSVHSALVDGVPSGVRLLADGASVDLDAAVNMANCEKASACTSSDLIAVTPERPWGPNNPAWRPYAYGPAGDFLPGVLPVPACFVLVLVGDDAAELDGDPERDSAPGEPGGGVIALRAEAFGLRGTHRVVELTVARMDTAALERGYNTGQPTMRVLSWREVR